jgi:hypothetical protein
MTNLGCVTLGKAVSLRMQDVLSSRAGLCGARECVSVSANIVGASGPNRYGRAQTRHSGEGSEYAALHSKGMGCQLGANAVVHASARHET